MKNKRGTQRVTKTDQKVDSILKKKKIKPSHIEQLTKRQEKAFFKKLEKKVNESKGEERDVLFAKILAITNDQIRNQIWESNHGKIGQTIAYLVESHGAMPNKSIIAKEAGLSRKTVHKHLKEYAAHPLYLEELELYRFMTVRLLGKVLSCAFEGDVRAAKLYFDIVRGGENKGGTLIQNQNNFIQVNGTTISQEEIKELSEEQLKKIEETVRSVVEENNKG